MPRNERDDTSDGYSNLYPRPDAGRASRRTFVRSFLGHPLIAGVVLLLMTPLILDTPVRPAFKHLIPDVLSGLEPTRIIEKTPIPFPTPPTWGNTYASGVLGFTLSWGNPWQEDVREEDDGYERIRVTDGDMLVTFTGHQRWNGDPSVCLAETERDLIAWPAVSNVREETGLNDDPLKMADGREQRTAVYTYTSTSFGQSTTRAAFVACIVLIPGEQVLAVMYDSPKTTYDRNIASRDRLLAGVAWSSE